MKVLVTGGAGFIGSHVIDACRERAWDVVCIDSLDPGVHHGAPDYLRKDVDYCFADLRHWVPGERFDDIEGIVHLAALGGVSRAAREPSNIISSNVVGTARLAEYASKWKKLKRFVLAGSFSVYGSNYSYRCPECRALTSANRLERDLGSGRFEVYCPGCGIESGIVPINESASPGPLEAYGSSKYMQELALKGFNSCPVNILRFSSVYGRRLRLDDGEATIIAKLAGWIRSGITPKLFEDGNQIRDWVHVDDVVDAVMALLEGEKEAHGITNVCSGVPTTLKEACMLIAKAAGRDCPPEIVGGFRPGDMRHCLGDATRLTELIGRPPVPFSKGVGILI
ncbi:MAG: NAD-dependent epimerase/dehydratase family protein [Deltaproteobacteria bacterium]|nr:NAD-dependent epimerase/dehydratase family protein [Deltaproteobacteria bacterium]